MNSAAYNAALSQHGSLTVWFTNTGAAAQAHRNASNTCLGCCYSDPGPGGDAPDRADCRRINLLKQLQRENELGVLFISHDLAAVQHLCNRVSVLYLGRIVETAPTRMLFRAPRHPYTAALLDAAPQPDPARRRSAPLLRGEIPRPDAPPSGCVFRTRCPHALPRCAHSVPVLTEVAPGHWKACLRDDVP